MLLTSLLLFSLNFFYYYDAVCQTNLLLSSFQRILNHCVLLTC